MKNIKQKIIWSLRRYILKIPSNALVLEVGSGGNPYPRSNVLVDAYEETQERHWDKLIYDRPTVVAFGENLPFKDKAFDYVIAAHVLEHTAFPEKFLQELERVASAGFIETPDAFMERINPYKDHRLEVTLRNDEMIINKKVNWIDDEDTVELYEHRVKELMVHKVIPNNPEKFHMRYFWRNKINFRILNPEADATWTPPMADMIRINPLKNVIQKTRFFALRFIRIVLSQTRRNKNLDIFPILRCTKCFSSRLRKELNCIGCNNCGAEFLKKGNIYIMK